MNGQATYNITDDTIHLHPDERLSDEQYEQAKQARFRWWPASKEFVATWNPAAEDFVHGLGIEEIEDVTEDDDPEARAERYATYSAHAQERSDAAYQRVEAICERIPLGQPILIGHHSEKGARADQKRITNGMNAACAERSKAEYWRDRARAAVRHAAHKLNPGVIARRIERLEADLRGCQRKQSDPTWSQWREHYDRWVAHLEMVLAYQRELYEASGGVLAAQFDIKPGDLVSTGRNHWYQVVRVNQKTVSVKTPYSWTDKIEKSKIVEHQKGKGESA